MKYKKLADEMFEKWQLSAKTIQFIEEWKQAMNGTYQKPIEHSEMSTTAPVNKRIDPSKVLQIYLFSCFLLPLMVRFMYDD
jgi:hypothetical protein